MSKQTRRDFLEQSLFAAAAAAMAARPSARDGFRCVETDEECQRTSAGGLRGGPGTR